MSALAAVRKNQRPVWAAFISGRGSNLSRLLSLQHEIDLRLVVTSNAKAEGVFKARRAGVSVLKIPIRAGTESSTKSLDWDLLTKQLRWRGITHIALAGFMKIVPEVFVREWENRIVNLHPSMLPRYPGLKSIENAYRDRSDVGVTVHLVNEEVDAGRILAQKISVSASETSSMSGARAEFLVHVDEQRLFGKVIARLKGGSVR